MMPTRRATAALIPAALLAAARPAAAQPTPVRNIVLVHGAWVDGSGWKPVHDLLRRRNLNVSIVQEPETSFRADVDAVRRVLDLQDGPTILVGHSYGGSIVTEAGVHPKVAGLVYVAAHAPDVGEDEAALGRRMPSVLARTEGAIRRTPDGYTYLDPELFPRLFAPDVPRERAEFAARSQVFAMAEVFSTPLTEAAWKSRPSWGIVAGDDQIISPDLERFYYERAGASFIVIPGASHSVYEVHPTQVAAVIENAARPRWREGDRPRRTGPALYLGVRRSGSVRVGAKPLFADQPTVGRLRADAAGIGDGLCGLQLRSGDGAAGAHGPRLPPVPVPGVRQAVQ